MRLWRNAKDVIKNGCKYLVLRRDNTVPEVEWFVLLAKDPAAPDSLRAYADKAEKLNMDPAYVQDIRDMADDWDIVREKLGPGDPDAGPHRTDDPAVVDRMVDWK